MTIVFDVRPTSSLRRHLKNLIPRHPELTDRYAEALDSLEKDPHNRTRNHNINKLELGRYPVSQRSMALHLLNRRRVVFLHYRGFRREDTYRA